MRPPRRCWRHRTCRRPAPCRTANSGPAGTRARLGATVAIAVAQQGDAVGAWHAGAGLLHRGLLHPGLDALAARGPGRCVGLGHQHVAIGQHVQPARVVQAARECIDREPGGGDGRGAGRPARGRRDLQRRDQGRGRAPAAAARDRCPASPTAARFRRTPPARTPARSRPAHARHARCRDRTCGLQCAWHLQPVMARCQRRSRPSPGAGARCAVRRPARPPRRTARWPCRHDGAAPPRPRPHARRGRPAAGSTNCRLLDAVDAEARFAARAGMLHVDAVDGVAVAVAQREAGPVARAGTAPGAGGRLRGAGRAATRRSAGTSSRPSRCTRSSRRGRRAARRRRRRRRRRTARPCRSRSPSGAVAVVDRVDHAQQLPGALGCRPARANAIAAQIAACVYWPPFSRTPGT